MNRAYFALPLIALVAVPTLVATLDALSDHQFRELTVARESARTQVRAVSARLDERILMLENTAALLQASDAVRLARRGESCGEALTRATTGLQGIQHVTVVDRAGRVQCTTVDALTPGRLVRGDNALKAVIRGRIDRAITTGIGPDEGFALAVPLRDDAGNAIGALAVATTSASLLGDPGLTSWLIQEGGEVMGQTVGDTTERIAGQTLAELRSFFVGRIATEVEALGGDGVRRVFGVLPGGGHPLGVTIAVGVPVAASAAGVSRGAAGAAPLLTLVISALLAAALAWTFRERVPDAVLATEDAPGADRPQEEKAASEAAEQPQVPASEASPPPAPQRFPEREPSRS